MSSSQLQPVLYYVTAGIYHVLPPSPPIPSSHVWVKFDKISYPGAINSDNDIWVMFSTTNLKPNRSNGLINFIYNNPKTFSTKQSDNTIPIAITTYSSPIYPVPPTFTGTTIEPFAKALVVPQDNYLLSKSGWNTTPVYRATPPKFLGYIVHYYTTE